MSKVSAKYIFTVSVVCQIITLVEDISLRTLLTGVELYGKMEANVHGV